MNQPGSEDRTHTHEPHGLGTRSQDECYLGTVEGFRFVRVLGSGGMGVVYEAIDLQLHRAVAVKVIKPESASDPAYRDRFLREARAVAAIDHENVVPILHVGGGDKNPYLVMPLLAGETLERRLTREPRPTLGESVGVARGVAAGLAAVHARGLIHRDVKPSNIWLDAATGRPRLLDFGLARTAEGGSDLVSRPGAILGTPAYMAPEQAAGRGVDHRADLFSLACVLYELLTGRRAFSGPDVMAILSALATHSPPPVYTVNPAVPPGLSALVAELLSKNPDRRPNSASEVHERLGRAELERAETLSSHTIETVEYHPARPSRRRALFFGAGAATVGLGGYGAWLGFSVRPAASTHGPVVLGVLHSQTGTTAVSESPVTDATLLAVDEINAAGGVLGRPLETVQADGKSDADEFARQAERLLTEERVAALFGCWTSASRKSVLQVLNRRNVGLLFYPARHEGLEQSPRIVYLGPTPGQQLIPAIDFLTRPVEKGGLGKKRLALVGSDYVFPRVASHILRDQVKLREKDGIQLVGEYFTPVGATDGAFSALILRWSPDAVVNTVSGPTNLGFFRQLRVKAQRTPAELPVLSLSLTENEVMGLNPAFLAGDYLAASYFQTVDRPQGREFLRRFRERHGPTRVVTDPMAAAYAGVHLWARAAEKARTTEPDAVRDALRGLEFDGPRCRERIDPGNLHAWLPARIGRIRTDGGVDLVPGAGSDAPLAPVPYPPTRTPAEWDQLLRGLQFQWDGKWQAPDKK